MRRRFPFGLLAAVVAYVLLRAAILHTSFDEVALVNYELYPMGTLPKALQLGADFPLRLYYDNAAGQLVTGVAAWPMYVLFGDRYLSLKLVPALAGLGMVVVVWALLARHASRRAANLGALALALGPSELLAKYSLIASGNHFENLFFTSLAVLCAYRLHVAPPERRTRWLVASGVTAGFALFVFLGALIPLGLLALVHLGVRGWRGALRDLRAVVPAFLVGVAPLVVLNVLSGARGLGFLQAKFSGGGGGEARDWGLVLDRSLSFAGDELFRAGFFQGFDGVSWRVASAILCVAFGLAWLACVPAALAGAWEALRGATSGTRPDPARAFARLRLFVPVWFVPLTALAYGLSNLDLGGITPPLQVAGYRYFLPTSLVGVALVAVVADRLWARGGAGRALGALLGTALVAPGLWNLAYVRPGSTDTGVGAHYRGWNFMQAGRGLMNHTAQSALEERVHILRSLPQPWRTHLVRGAGFYEVQAWLATRRSSDDLALVQGAQVPAMDLLHAYPEDLRLELARGMGAGLRNYILMRGNGERLVQAVRDGLAAYVAQGDPYAYAMVEGAAMANDTPLPWRRVPAVLARSVALLDALPEALRATYGGGLGEVAGRLYARELAPEAEWLGTWLRGLYPRVGRPLLVGLGRGLALEEGDPRIPPAIDELATAADPRAAVREGFVAGLRSLYSAERVDEILAAQRPEWR